jgi:hypothetical protein
VVDSVIQTADNGVRTAVLVSGGSFQPVDGFSVDQGPLPVRDTGEIAAIYAESGRGGDEPSLNVFDLNDAISTGAFIGLLVLMLLPIFAALYAGFDVGRRFGRGSVGSNALWGAAIGPVWALTMVVLASLAQEFTFSDPSGDSVFVIHLIGGALLGAAGGALAGGGAQHLSSAIGSTAAPKGS